MWGIRGPDAEPQPKSNFGCAPVPPPSQNNAFPGPTLRVAPGERFELVFKNELGTKGFLGNVEKGVTIAHFGASLVPCPAMYPSFIPRAARSTKIMSVISLEAS